MKEIIDSILQDELNSEESEKVIELLLSEDNLELKKQILQNFHKRKITFDELHFFRNYIFSKAKKIELGNSLLDVCGTGGDGKNTFNISSLVAVVLGSMGIKLAKHGNYSASSMVGSSNILESFGVKFTNDQIELENKINKFNLVFLHAPLFHPVLKNVAAIRKELSFRTFFNLLGPLANPASPQYQVNGVSSQEDQDLLAKILQKMNKKFYLVYDLNGYDEISLTGKTRIVGKHEFYLEPHDFGLTQIDPEILKIENSEHAKEIFLDVLQGKDLKKIEVVAANASLALNLINQTSFKDGTKFVVEKLMSGEVEEYFKSYNG